MLPLSPSVSLFLRAGKLEPQHVQAAFEANTLLMILSRVPQVGRGSWQQGEEAVQAETGRRQSTLRPLRYCNSYPHRVCNSLHCISHCCGQILTNFRSWSTGQLSLITCSINVVGCIVRVFTTLSEGAGTAMLRQGLCLCAA